MKKQFDKYSIRGLIFSSISSVGLAYTILSGNSRDLFLMLMVSLVLGLGLSLLFWIHEPPE